MRSLWKIAIVGILLITLAACSQEEASAPATQGTGVVKATQAYLDNFGPPPQGKAGEAFARVGYLPLRQSPDKVKAFPLFLFSEKEQLRQILNRLVSGKLNLPPDLNLYNPFPGDIEVMTTPLDGPSLTLSLMTQSTWPDADMKAAGLALSETVLQFTRVERVVIMLNGRPLPHMPEGGYQHQPHQLAKVAPPILVLLAGMWEKGSDNLDELLIEFDRPIKVNQIKLYDLSGQTVDGEYFTSIFQMAVVIQPKAPESFQPGDLLRAEWDIVDELGRSNNGSTTLPLQRFEH
jgi:hypothetical protein